MNHNLAVATLLIFILGIKAVPYIAQSIVDAFRNVIPIKGIISSKSQSCGFDKVGIETEATAQKNMSPLTM